MSFYCARSMLSAAACADYCSDALGNIVREGVGKIGVMVVVCSCLFSHNESICARLLMRGKGTLGVNEEGGIRRSKRRGRNNKK